MNVTVSIQTGERLNTHLLACAWSGGTDERLENVLPEGSVEAMCGEFPEDAVAAHVKIEGVEVSGDNAETLLLGYIERAFHRGLREFGYEDVKVSATRQPTEAEVQKAIDELTEDGGRA